MLTFRGWSAVLPFEVHGCDLTDGGVPASAIVAALDPGSDVPLRQYFPKGTDLSKHARDDLTAVAEALNTRPRKTLGWKTPVSYTHLTLPTNREV